MPDDPLDTNPPAVPPPAPDSRKIVCEYCGCQLTQRGEVLRMGDAAKNFRKHEEIVEAKDKEIRVLNEEISALKKERDALKGGTVAAAHRAGQRVT